MDREQTTVGAFEKDEEGRLSIESGFSDEPPLKPSPLKYTQRLLPNQERPEVSPVAPCVRCGRYTQDPTRDFFGYEMPEYHFVSEDDRKAVCDGCHDEDLGRAFAEETLKLLEEKLGLGEGDKKTLEALKSIVDNPDRVLAVMRLHDKVDELERRMEDRAQGMRSELEAKLEGANTRGWVSSLILGVVLAVTGFLAGVLATLALGS